MRRGRAELSVTALAAAALVAAACAPSDDHRKERLTIPDGANLQEVSDTLAAHDLIRWPALFRLYVRLRGRDDDLKAGTYELSSDSGWSGLLETLVAGRVVTVPITIPEGWTVVQIARRVAEVARVPGDSAAQRLLDPRLADSLGVPGPTLEGYLYPETYRFAHGVRLEAIAAQAVDRYRSWWTSERRAALDSSGLSEHELVTLASIVQAEARREDEMPVIAAVFHNRLRRGMRLQADPTVQYALETRRSRLLFAHIDSVADHPYNTYTHDGLPPGPICSPGESALNAALDPATVPYLYFVAQDDGRHVFSRTLIEHNRAIDSLRSARRRRRSPN